MAMFSDEKSTVDHLVGEIAKAFKSDRALIDVRADLFNPDGFAIGTRVLDSLELVELITVLEETLGIELQELLETREELSIQDIAIFLVGHEPT